MFRSPSADERGRDLGPFLGIRLPSEASQGTGRMECLGSPRDKWTSNRAHFWALGTNSRPTTDRYLCDCRITHGFSAFSIGISVAVHTPATRIICLSRKQVKVALRYGQVLVSGRQRQMLAKAMPIGEWTAIC